MSKVEMSAHDLYTILKPIASAAYKSGVDRLDSSARFYAQFKTRRDAALCFRAIKLALCDDARVLLYEMEDCKPDMCVIAYVDDCEDVE